MWLAKAPTTDESDFHFARFALLWPYAISWCKPFTRLYKHQLGENTAKVAVVADIERQVIVIPKAHWAAEFGSSMYPNGCHSVSWYSICRVTWFLNGCHIKSAQMTCLKIPPIAQDALWPVSYVGVTGKWGLLSHVQNAVRCKAGASGTAGTVLAGPLFHSSKKKKEKKSSL